MPELVALLDLGSNAARFLLARISPGVGYRVLREERVQTRLGSGRSGRLPREAVEATLTSARRFLRHVGDNGHAPRVVAVATAAVRDAANRELLLGALRERDAVEVHVLSGPEEARLGALAALRSLSIRNGVVADLGGGSLQLACIRGGRIGPVASLPLGAIRLTRRFLHRDPPTRREMRALREEVRRHVLDAVSAARAPGHLVGLGGTVRALARMHLAAHPSHRAGRHGLRLSESDVSAIRERLERLPLAKRRRVRGLKAERADVIVAGVLALEELMLSGEYATLTVCTRGVRDGVLWRETLGQRITDRS
jgi:exopolyphosphatase/guanosine-5'-triphosphate,3'-diphosphate pyrophosphatase